LIAARTAEAEAHQEEADLASRIASFGMERFRSLTCLATLAVGLSGCPHPAVAGAQQPKPVGIAQGRLAEGRLVELDMGKPWELSVPGDSEDEPRVEFGSPSPYPLPFSSPVVVLTVRAEGDFRVEVLDASG
jgi:hypothetical protein